MFPVTEIRSGPKQRRVKFEGDDKANHIGSVGEPIMFFAFKPLIISLNLFAVV
jgi:hypothetical protein